VEVATARRSARITGNAWKRFPISYAVTNRTILEFTVNAPDTGEILGIILDDETAATVGRRGILVGGANVDGTAHSAWSWTVAAPTRYQAGSGPKNYSIPVGTFFTGQVNYVVLVGNDDADEGSTDATFSNIQLHEGTAPKTYSDWKAGITWGSIPENQRNETDDPDGDGRNNATERAFGGNPAASDTDSGSGIESSKNPDGSRILKVLYRKGVREMNYVLQQSTTLSTWADVTGSSESYDGSKGYHFRTWTAPANQTRGFTRIKATDAQ